MKPKTQLIFFIFCFISFQYSFAQKEYLLDSTTIEVKPLVKNLVVPWEIIWGPDDHIWMTHNKGVVSRVDPSTGSIDNVLTLPDIYRNPNSLNDSRMMGLAIGSDFQEAPFVYINYVYQDNQYTSRNWFKYMKVVKYRYDEANTNLVEPQVLLDGIKVYDGWHVGGKLLIDPSNQYLFLSIGDAKQPENPDIHPDWTSSTPKPLSLESFSGKVLRIGIDGSVPQDNPFATSSIKSPKNLIWSYGHRNTQGLVFGRNNLLYYAEHGPANDDETGIIQKGGDFGWPSVEGFCNTSSENTYCNSVDNHIEPLKAWPVPIAPSNMEYYSSSAIPEWENSLLVASLTGTNREGEDIRVLKLSEDGSEITDETILFDNESGSGGEYLRIRDLCVSPNGDIYFTSSNLVLNKGRTLGNDDIIWKISAKAPSLSTANDITAFSIPEQLSDAIIDTVNHRITVEMDIATQISALTPTISISEAATISPASEVTQDFTNPVIYTVTAEDGTSQEWQVAVNVIVTALENIVENSPLFYPNPVQDILKITGSKGLQQLYFYTLEGKLTKQFDISKASKIDISELRKGIYLAVFEDKNNSRKVFRIVKE